MQAMKNKLQGEQGKRMPALSKASSTANICKVSLPSVALVAQLVVSPFEEIANLSHRESLYILSVKVLSNLTILRNQSPLLRRSV